MAYTKIVYQNSPSTATPLNAENLNHMDDQIALNDQRLTEIATSYVKSFKGRKGDVTAQNGDYNIGQITPLTGAQVGQVPVVTNIGTEEDPELVFRMGAGGGGGHSIIDSSGNTMPQESAMQFADSFVSDDDVNGRTIVENIKEHTTKTDYDNATEAGFHVIDDGNDVPIGASSEDKVEVDVTTSMTYANAFALLFADVDLTKITDYSYIDILGSLFILTNNSSTLKFTNMNGASNRASMDEVLFNGTNAYFYNYNLYTHSRTDNTNENIWTNGKIKLYYGTSSTVINLKTSADYCEIPTGVPMSVDKALKYMRYYSVGISNGSSVTLNIDQSDRFTIFLNHSGNVNRTYVGFGCGGTNAHIEDIIANASVAKSAGSKTITLTNNTGGTISGWVEIWQSGAFSIT